MTNLFMREDTVDLNFSAVWTVRVPLGPMVFIGQQDSDDPAVKDDHKH